MCRERREKGEARILDGVGCPVQPLEVREAELSLQGAVREAGAASGGVQEEEVSSCTIGFSARGEADERRKAPHAHRRDAHETFSRVRPAGGGTRRQLGLRIVLSFCLEGSRASSCSPLARASHI